MPLAYERVADHHPRRSDKQSMKGGERFLCAVPHLPPARTRFAAEAERLRRALAGLGEKRVKFTVPEEESDARS
jgi:hypothetical protein